MTDVRVDLGERSYSVFVDHGAVSRIDEMLPAS